MNRRILVDIENHVAHIRINRPEKMNAVDSALLEQLIEAGDALRKDPTVRAGVISGDGRGFCAGLDTDNFANIASGQAAKADLITRTHDIANTPQHAVLQWRTFPVPVIAAIHGFAFGAGFQLALGADIRYVHPTAKLCIAEINWGLIPDMAGMLILRNLVRPDIAAELVYGGRIFSGTESLEYGIATQLSESPIEKALQLASTIAQKNPQAIRAAKKIFSLDVDTTLPQKILLAESVEQAALIGSANQIEAINAARENRYANFKDPKDMTH